MCVMMWVRSSGDVLFVDSVNGGLCPYFHDGMASEGVAGSLARVDHRIARLAG